MTEISPESNCVRTLTIIWINAGILLIGPLRTNFSGIVIGIQTFKKMHLKMSSGKCRPFFLGLDVLRAHIGVTRRQWMNSLWPSDVIWRQIFGSTLVQVMDCCLTAPNHYLNQCWLIIIKVQWHSSDPNFTRDTSDINHLNKLESYLFRISLKSHREQWVNSSWPAVGWLCHGKEHLCPSTLIPEWISNYIHYKVWHEIIYQFLNLNGCTVEV